MSDSFNGCFLLVNIADVLVMVVNKPEFGTLRSYAEDGIVFLVMKNQKSLHQKQIWL